ncbi:gliding motility-associated C-terminal domain-containing protein [Pedobacter sp. UYEF25]
MRSSANTRFLLAGTNKGLYYIRSFSFQPDLTLPAAEGVMMALGKVNGIATEISNGSNRAPESLIDFCEQVIWVATDAGIKKLTINPINVRGDICSSFLLSSDNPQAEGTICANPFFNLCGGGVDLHLNLPADYAQRYDVKWMRSEDNYGDRVEMIDLHGRKSILVTRRGTYGVIVTSLCENIVTEIGNITIRNTPDPMITFQPPDEINICQGGSKLLTTAANNTYRYQWMKDGNPINGGTSNTYRVTSPGVYLVEVNNCDEYYTPSKSVKVNFLQLPEPIITRSTDKSLCYGETVKLTAPLLLGATYRWSSGETTREIEVNKSGDYFFSMTLDSYCQKVSAPTAVIVQSEIKLDHLPEIQICTIRKPSLRPTAAEGFETYTWQGQAGTANYLEVTEPGTYTLEVADAGGCKAYTAYIVVAYCPPLSPANAFSPNGDGLNDVWKVERLEDHPEAVVRVYNRYGVIVFEGKGIKPVWDGRIHGEDIPEGVYYYVITTKSAKPITGSVTLIR